jgi:nicotinic acid phosphoribosyltransferase
MEEDRRRGDSIRYDSGDKEKQYRFAAAEAKRRGLRPVQILEDSFDAPLTRRFEELRQEVGLMPEEQFYGYGGHLVAVPSGSPLSRDRVAAVYKLSETARWPTMKFGDEASGGKDSVPGKPTVFRRRTGEGAPGLIGQQGETPPPGYFSLTDSGEPSPRPAGATVEPSEETHNIIANLRAERARMLAAAKGATA